METLKAIGTGIVVGLLGFLITFALQFGLGLAGGATFGLDVSLWPIIMQILGSYPVMIISSIILGIIIFKLMYERH